MNVPVVVVVRRRKRGRKKEKKKTFSIHFIIFPSPLIFVSQIFGGINASTISLLVEKVKVGVMVEVVW